MVNLLDDFSLLIGIDWANDKHDVCVQSTSGDRKLSVLSSSPEGIHEWITNLSKVHPGKIAVCVELSKGPIVYALQKYEFVTIFPIQPIMLARYRQAFSPSGAKDDPTDAEIALDLLLNYSDKIKPLKVQGEATRKLSFLVEQRRRLVEDRRRFANRLINNLKHYYPQPLEWFSHRDTELFCDFLIKWPCLNDLKRARANTIRAFLNAKGVRATSFTEERLGKIKQAIPQTIDVAILSTHSLMTIALANQLKATIEAIRIFTQQIDKLFNSLPDATLFNSLPGTGSCLAPRLFVALGEERDRFGSAEEIQKYAGVAPVVERSGKKCWVHWRWQCSKFLRQSFIEWASKTRNSSYWAGLYYQNQRNRGKSHQMAVRALAYKWIRILYRCWKTKTEYSESKYLKALAERNSPLLAQKS